LKGEKIMAVDGTYNVEIDTPMGKQESKLTLQTDGSALSGTMENPMGKLGFSGGTVNGDEVAWEVEIPGPMGRMTIGHKLRVSGDDISGEVRLGDYGSAPLKGKRA
jgi:hypothetical protein